MMYQHPHNLKDRPAPRPRYRDTRALLVALDRLIEEYAWYVLYNSHSTNRRRALARSVIENRGHCAVLLIETMQARGERITVLRREMLEAIDRNFEAIAMGSGRMSHDGKFSCAIEWRGLVNSFQPSDEQRARFVDRMVGRVFGTDAMAPVGGAAR